MNKVRTQQRTWFERISFTCLLHLYHHQEKLTSPAHIDEREGDKEGEREREKERERGREGGGGKRWRVRERQTERGRESERWGKNRERGVRERERQERGNVE